MPLLKKRVSAFSVVVFLAMGAIWISTCTNVMAQMPQPLVSEETLTKVSEHVFVLAGYPNIGIVVGARATLVIDTGLGERNGATVVRVAQKLAKGPTLYLTTTHYHSEHTSGEQAFPTNTIIIRPAAQQEEMNKLVAAHIDLFRSRSEQNKELLKDVRYRVPDIIFDREVKLDLGGVTARLFWLGAAHTKGDELIFVEEDSILLPGDIVQKNFFPIMPDENSNVKGWLAILDQLESLNPRLVVPDHAAPVVDASQIGKERAYLLDLQARASELKHQNVSVDEAGKIVTTEFHAKYPDWPNTGNIAGEVMRVYNQTQ
jgi:glyoxylase-like metal-dependent hydrolase (beta-lactamase superfamily II)